MPKISQKIFSVFIFGLLVGFPQIALAQNDKDIYVLPAEESIEGNLIKFAERIEISGNVQGDVFLFAKEIVVNGKVSGSVMAAGEKVEINGEIEDSIKVISQNFALNGQVLKNVYSLAEKTTLGSSTTIGWDLNTASKEILVDGNVGRSVWLAGVNISLHGTIDKNANVAVDDRGSLILDQGASVGGDLIYQASPSTELQMAESAQVGGEIKKNETKFVASENWDKFFTAWFWFVKTVSFFSLLVIGIILVTLLPRLMLNINDKMVANPGASVLWGLVFVLLMPLVGLALMFTIIGLPLALLLGVLYFVTLYLSCIFAAFGIGLFLLNRGKNQAYRGSLIWPLVLGLLVFVLLGSIPFIGWLFKALAILWSIGGILKFKKELIKEYR